MLFKKGSFFSLLEIASNNPIDGLIETLYENVNKEGVFDDCLISENESQFKNIW